MRVLIYFMLAMTITSSCTNMYEKKRDKTYIKSQETSLNKDFIAQKSEMVCSIPSSLLDYIEDKLKEYAVPEIDDYIEGWESFSKDQEYPYFISSDFTGDNRIDYAILLKNIRGSLTLFVFHYLNEEQYVHYQIYDFYLNAEGIDVLLSIEPKGVWESVFETVKTKADGILVELIVLSRSTAYYWDGQKYVNFPHD